jgi:hypothetical protein
MLFVIAPNEEWWDRDACAFARYLPSFIQRCVADAHVYVDDGIVRYLSVRDRREPRKPSRLRE